MTDFDPRRALPGQAFTYHDETGQAHTLTADDEGVVRPKDRLGAEVLEGFGLPVARKAIAEERAKRTTTESAPATPAKED